MYRPIFPTVLVLLLASVGCGDRMYSISGTVTLEDGPPLTKGMVVFERVGDKPVMARGAVQPDGRYELGTNRPGDGVLTGKYREQINHMDLSEVPDEKKNLPYDLKYLKFETSGLEYDVPAASNDYPIKLDRPQKGKR
jgi:hypothetical protein